MKSPINYFGGKSRLSKIITKHIPPDHLCYCEPFCGAAWILFAKEPVASEIINDMDGELITFWRVIQNHITAFLDYFKFAVISRAIFEIESQKDPTTLTDIQRAVRYYYLQRLAFGGKTANRTYGTGTTKISGLKLSSLEESLVEVHWRLKKVNIERLDALDCIRRYDRPHTFFFIDPPYMNNTKDYAVHFDRFVELRDTLKAIKGRFILTLSDSPQAREMFADFYAKGVTLVYSCANARTTKRGKTAKEVLFSNYRLEK